MLIPNGFSWEDVFKAPNSKTQGLNLSLFKLVGSESANLVCSPFFPPGILRSQAGEHLCRNDSHIGSGTKQERGGEGGRGGEAVLTPAGATCRPLSPGLALTCVGSEPHTDCSPQQVQAVSNHIMHFCSERRTSDHGWSLKFMQCGQFIDCDLDFAP